VTIDWKAVVAQAQPTTKVVRLCLRGDLVASLQAIQNRIDASGATPAPEDVAEAKTLLTEVEEATVTFTLKGLTRQAYRALEAKHPAPDGGGGWNMETFPEALVRACLTDPVVDAGDPLFDVLTPGQVGVVFDAAFLACNEVDAAPLPKRG
jgi:hypothetical protein